MNSFSFLRDESLTRIWGAIKAQGHARVVGGAVRDALLGKTAEEIDLAVDLTPEKVSALLTQAGIKVVPTGLDHGTVTAVVDHKGYEITTLRRDIETDGRRAKVAFTDDWKEDAARRDFTFNALYVDADGKLYDYFDGQEDLKAGRVRFIGDARARIREDVLRILRFFRFYAWFGKGAPDAEGFAACRELAALIPTLSFERVGREIIKMLQAAYPAAAWKAMEESGVLACVLSEAKNRTRLEALLKIETRYGVAPFALTRLAALLPKDEAVADKAAKTLRLSNRDAEKLRLLATLPDRLKGKLDPVPFRRMIYAFGANAAHDAALLLAAEDEGVDLEPALSAAAEWDNPRLPLQGEDVLKLGLKAGPKVGALLRTIEEWWAARDFRPSREECLAEAKKHMGSDVV